jgi:hypothetical protein
MAQLTAAQLDEFDRRGVLVVPSVLTRTEVRNVRAGFHTFLRRHGVDPDDLGTSASHLTALSSTGGSGGVLDVFYEGWKLAVNEHPSVVRAVMDVWAHTYGTATPDGDGVYSHPFGPFDPRKGYMYIDRVCFRVPEAVNDAASAAVASSSSSSSSSSSKNKKKARGLQRSLTPHIDCCPHRMFTSVGKKAYNKWRPVQAFVALTDTVEPQRGGFEACPGFHRDFAAWAATRAAGPPNTAEPPCVGQFTPIRPVEDADVLRRFEHIPCRAGDLVLWDYRVPHANAYRNDGDRAREVVYVGFLPDVEVNRAYAADQLAKYLRGDVPTDQWHEHTAPQPCDHVFTPLGRQLMGMDTW